MATTADFRNGMTMVIDGDLYSIVEFLHVKPGKGGAFVRTKLRNVHTGRVIDRTFRAGENVEQARIERREMQYLYRSAGQFFFMDTSTYEQISIPDELVGDAVDYMVENTALEVLFHNDQVIGLELPIFVEVRIKETDPGVRGDTASGGSKPATLETGAVVQVPFFVDVDDVIKVDTRRGIYVERVK
ncbi:MAG: elongation factor P [candidate division Zixibacteria bacterium SM23_81]|nr:MAG: elongation factor P [candidate division Zixibacteria bacterium SM23_81]